MYFFLQRYSERSLLAHCGLVENRPWGFQFEVKRLKDQHTCAITANSSTSLHPILSTKKIELQLPKNVPKTTIYIISITLIEWIQYSH